MNDGWIKLFRKLTEWEWYSDVNTCRVFIHLIITANHQNKKWRGKQIKRGQLITSLQHLSDETNLSVMSIRTAIKNLKSTNEVTSEATSRFTMITLCNYDTYQSREDDTNKPTNKPTNKRTTNEQQTNNNKQECKELEEGKEEKKEREEKSGGAPLSLSKKSESQLRAEKLFNRRIDTPLSKNEQTAWKNAKAIVNATTETEWKVLEMFHSAPQDQTFARKGLAALLNNFTDELFKASQWAKKHGRIPTATKGPQDWQRHAQEILIESSFLTDKEKANIQSAENFTDLFSNIQTQIFKRINKKYS